jgi:hypothetical protein
MTGHRIPADGSAPASVPPGFPMPPTAADVHPATPLGSPPATGDTVTPGQAFRATVMERRRARCQPVDIRDYGQLPEEDRADLEAGAQAAITAGTGKILAECARYRAERNEARDQLKAVEKVLAATRRERDQLGTVLDEIATSSDIHGELAREALEATP